jgi:hypothetical protein
LKNHYIAKSIQWQSWNKFITILKYKKIWYWIKKDRQILCIKSDMFSMWKQKYKSKKFECKTMGMS